MATTSLTTIFEYIFTGFFSWIADAAIYMFVFAILWTLFEGGIKLVSVWRR